MLWALHSRVLLPVSMNDFAVHVACNETRGSLCAEKWQRLLENVIFCMLRFPEELNKTEVLYLL
jgi:hypothetical protein